MKMKNSLLSLFALLISTVGFSQTQPPNVDFENWESLPFGTGTMEEPYDWNTSNQCTALLNVTPVTKSTDAYSGSFSARLESHDGPGAIVVNGVLTTADIICGFNSGGQEGGYPYNTVPDSVVGWYKYNPVNNDSAYSQVMFLANGDLDTISYTRIDFPQAATTWTRFSAPISPTSSTPDKLSLFFSSSWGDGAQGEGEVGSVFFIDAVEFVFVPEGIDEAESERTWTVYPNPVMGELNVQVLRGEEANIEIIDVTGKLVKKERVNEMNHKIDVNQLVTGIYLYQIRSLENEVLRTGKLLVNP